MSQFRIISNGVVLYLFERLCHGWVRAPTRKDWVGGPLGGKSGDLPPPWLSGERGGGVLIRMWGCPLLIRSVMSGMG